MTPPFVPSMVVSDSTLQILKPIITVPYDGFIKVSSWHNKIFPTTIRFAFRQFSKHLLPQKDTAGIKYALECYELGHSMRNPYIIYSGAVNSAYMYF